MSNFEGLSPEDKKYVLNLPSHLAEATDMANEFYDILTQFQFIQYKILSNKETQLLIEDYDFVEKFNIIISDNNKKNLRLIQDTLRLSATVLNKEPNQLVGQLWGRLQGFYQPAIQNLLEEARKSKSKTLRLRPLTNSLTIPSTPLIYNFTGHKGGVTKVIITPNEEKAISASKWDQTLII